MKLIILVIAIVISSTTFAQKRQLVESKEEVETLAAKEFELAMSPPEGELYLFGIENEIKGEYTFRITLGDRGKVVSVFAKGNKGGDILSQNKVKDAVKDFKFNFKLPKDKNFTLHHIFKF
jgi:hypothetical protein